MWFSRFFEKRALTVKSFSSVGGVLPFGDLNTSNVTPETAVYLSAVVCAVRVLAEGVASLPCILYERKGEGKERALAHPLYNLLRNEPNEDSTSIVFWETLVGQWALWGNAYAEIQRDGAGRPVALWHLGAKRIKPYRLSTGRLAYEFTDENGKTSTLAKEDLFHVPGLSPDGSVGYSIVQLARDTLAQIQNVEAYARAFFSNGTAPGSYLKTAGVLSDNARENLRKSFEDRHRGASQAHRLAVLEEGLEFASPAPSNEDSQYEQLRRFLTLEVARFWNIPPHKLKALDRSTWGNIESEALSFVTDTLRPILVRFEQEINRKLLLPSEKGQYYAEFLVDGLLRGDTISRYQAYQLGLSNGFLSVNEVRIKENLNPIEGGDTYSNGNTIGNADIQGAAPPDAADAGKPPNADAGDSSPV